MYNKTKNAPRNFGQETWREETMQKT